jgi:hypothetical protein
MNERKIKGTRTEGEVIERYPRLHQKFKNNLTDVYNFYLGLRLCAYGEDWQRDYALEGIARTLRDGQKPFPLCMGNIDERIRDSVASEDGIFSQLDLEHLTELENLVGFLNERGSELGVEEAQEAYDLLIPYLYGRVCEEKVQGNERGVD